MTRWMLLLCVSAAACDAKERAADVPGQPGIPALADTLVLTTGDGAGIWLTTGRAATSAGGVACVERTIEIRRDSARVRVPLLYTGDVPVLVNDSTIEARLWLHCEPGDRHRVSLRTGQPVKVSR